MIDLDAYFRRIGHTGPRTATLDVLNALCERHTASIVYENIDPLLGRAPQLSLAALQHKLITQVRGGYCYEQNLLLREVLISLGYTVTALAARVVWRQPPQAPLRPRSHMLLKVEVNGSPHVVDVGFGGHLMGQALRLEADTPQRTAHGLMRITAQDGVHAVETWLPEGWTPLYRYTLEAHHSADYEPLNWYTATHPGSIFCHNLMMERLTPTLRTSLLNDRYITRRPGEPPAMRRVAQQADFDRLLEEPFGLQLPAATRRAVFERIPKGQDQFVVPTA